MVVVKKDRGWGESLLVECLLSMCSIQPLALQGGRSRRGRMGLEEKVAGMVTHIYNPIIPAVWRLKQVHWKFKTSQRYIVLFYFFFSEKVRVYFLGNTLGYLGIKRV